VTLADDTDADLVARATLGSQAAFATLARRHGPRLARTVRALGVRPSEVEDVVQTTLISAWRGLSDFDPRRSFLAWISTIAANKARDWWRQHRVRRLWLSAEPLDGQEALAAVDPDSGAEHLDGRAELRRVEIAIRALPENLRTPLVLVAVTGLTQTEAALAMGISVKSVETRIGRARRYLAERLATGSAAKPVRLDDPAPRKPG
jgi:RNA polymerase sigma-70 factor (ECF subfamily)